MTLHYRGGFIYKDDFGWYYNGPYGGDSIHAWTRLIFPLCWRFRSDEEAMRILCERIDEYLDIQARAHALAEQRQLELDEREKILEEFDA